MLLNGPDTKSCIKGRVWQCSIYTFGLAIFIFHLAEANLFLKKDKSYYSRVQ
jgi:hypothetical protein